MTDPYFEWLEEQARVDDRMERAERAQARRDRLDDYASLRNDARAVPHLEAVTPAENIRRARLATGGYKLDADSVLTIRAKGASTRALARKFGISQSLVRNVQAGRSYAWVTA